MVRRSRPTRFTGSELIRLLARLTEVDDTESKVPFAERLSQWLSWTDAISLSAALNGSSPATATSDARAFASAEEGECERVRSALVNAFAEDSAFVADQGRGNLHPPASGAPTDTTADFSPYRRRYLAKQQAMEASISALRGRLRATLAARSSDMARLAAVDAVMEQVLGEHERSLLSTVPVLLEKRFKRLHRTDHAPQADTQAPAEHKGVQPEAWLDPFCKDMQSVLLAELDIRLQPVEGLLEALRIRQPGHHD